MKKGQFLLLAVFIWIFGIQNATALEPPPKYEFRGAWVATVANLDWPSSPSMNTYAQRIELMTLMDDLKKMGINAVIFQVRTECDAFYESPYEPWSYYLTGKQGRAPDPFYDPLEFAVEEAHRRGMELHAWFNPYRVQRKVGNYPLAANHVANVHPEWVITIGSYQFLDPGLPQVREYVAKIIADVVRRYDIDGVHFDDYFYPYPPNQITNQDDQTFANYSRGMTNKADWRRENVNLLVSMVYDSIRAIKPYVKFGISPFGIWKNGVPSGIVGLDAYSTIYCDGIAWLKRGIIDYITPQLYWPFGGGQDYGKLLPWWASHTNGRHLYAGQAAYRINSWSAGEMPRQIRLNRRTPNAWGSVYFRANSLRANPQGFADSLRTNYYRFPALPPPMNWKDSIPPNPPAALAYRFLEDAGRYGFSWQAGSPAPDGEPGQKYVLYRFRPGEEGTQDALAEASNMAAITGVTFSVPPVPEEQGPFVYGVTAADHNSNESGLSNLVEVSPPVAPVLAYPAGGAQDVADTVTLRWHPAAITVSAWVEVATDSAFSSGSLIFAHTAADSFRKITGLEAQTVYYWRVKGGNAGGYGPYSAVSWFKTGFPLPPVLLQPANDTTGVPVKPVFVWRSSPGATSYRIQLAIRPYFGASTTALDQSGLADTTYTGIELPPGRYYYWRVMASNSVGDSRSSEVFRFKTTEITAVAGNAGIPKTLSLSQNYPNPFNLETTFEFALPRDTRVSLKIYDLQGRTVAVVVDQEMQAGRYKIRFDASRLSSGVYFYRLAAGREIRLGKMLLIK